MLKELAYGLAFATAMAGMAACGAKVTVDMIGSGEGGGGGGAATTSGTSASAGVTTGSGVTCMSTGCSGTSDGACDCTDSCDVQGNTQTFEVQCAATSTGGACNCIENGTSIATCQGSTTTACDAVNGCCAGMFFSGTTGSGG